MSDFWDNNKEGIFKGAKTAGKYGFKGAKFVGKTGYQAVKNQRNANVSKQHGKSADGTESPDFGETRPISALPKVDNLPPPPLKPGQNQYTSKSRTPPAAQLATVQTTTQYDPNAQVAQAQYTQVQQQRPVPTPGQQPVYYQVQPGQQAQAQYQQNAAYVNVSPQNQQYASAQVVEQQQYPQQYPQQTPQQQVQRSVPQVPSRTSTSDQKSSGGNIDIPASQIQVSGQNISLPAYSINGKQAMNFAGKIASGWAASQQPQEQQGQVDSNSQQQAQQPQYVQQVQQPVQQQYTQQYTQQQFQSPVQPQYVQQQAQQPVQQPVQQQYTQQYTQQQVQPPVQPQYTQQPVQQAQPVQPEIPAGQRQAIQQEPVEQAQQPQQSFQQQLQQQLQQSLGGGPPSQQVLQETSQEPIQQVTELSEAQTSAAAPALDLKNPYYQGAVSVPQAGPESVSGDNSSINTESGEAAAPPLPGPRNYSRAAVPPPQVPAQQGIQQQPIPVQQQQQQPAQIPIPSTVNPQVGGAPSAQPKPQTPVTTGPSSPYVQSPDLSKLPLPPKHQDISPSIKSPQLTGGSVKSSGSLTSRKTTTEKKPVDENGDEIKRGIAGSYDYKIDVKFAPPPRPRGSTPAEPKRPNAKTNTTASRSSVPGLPSRSSTNSSPAPSTMPSSNARPLPPPRSTSTVHEEDHTNPPPPYTPQSTAESVPTTTTEQPVAPQSVLNKFAPPPKPFRKTQDDTKSNNKPDHSAQIQPPAPLSAASSFSLPPPARPSVANPSSLEEPSNPEPKKQPPPLKPKPSSFNRGDDDSKTKKVPPPLAPKPSGINVTKKTPPPIAARKPQISIPEKKSSPPVIPKKKPSFQAHAATNDFSKVVSELPQKNKDEPEPTNVNIGTNVKKSDIGGTKEDEIEDEENPFKRYLRNAVPKEDDRFHRSNR